jgi:hypothetical protein
MLQLTPQSRIFVAVEPVDFRKGIDGLGGCADARWPITPSTGRSTCFVTAPPRR